MPQTSLVTVDSRALTDLSSLKRRIGIDPDNTDQDEFLQELINQTSDMFERSTGRRFAASDYVERHDGYCEKQLSLKHYPVIYLKELRHGEATAISLTYSGSAIVANSDSYADTEGNNGGIRLHSVAANGTETTTDLTFTLYPTFSTMVTAINLISGWTATAATDGLCSWIIPQTGRNTKSTTIKFLYPDVSEGDLRVAPEAGIITFNSSTSSDSRFFEEDYESGAPFGYRNLMIRYKAGFTTVPDDIKKLVNDIAALAYASSTVNPAMKSETLGDYSYTLAATSGINSAFSAFEKEISYYKDLTIAKLGR